jgi:uncharacterized heparinase superfamily protein
MRLALSLDPAGLPDPYYSEGAGVAAVEALPWQAPVVSLERQAELHSFAWVAGLAATEGAAAAAPARTILRAWLDQYRQWDPVAWRADVAGERLCIWIAHAALLAPSEDPTLQKDFLGALSRQARHLRRTAHWEVDGIGRLKALRGLLAALLALRAGDRRIDAAFRAIEREANAQILRDGGHIGRSPALQVEALRQLIGMRDILDAANVEVPEAIMAAINRAAPILRFFRHGDGRLALFNDSVEGDSTALDVTLSRSGVKARAPASAPLIGFERLQSGKSLLIMDCGAPPPERFGGHPHAGTLSFELSHGRERLIVNCGAYRGASAQWQSAMRTTAAHSTLVLADAPSTEIDDRGHLAAAPRTVTRERTEEEGNQWAAASHDGYLARFGLTHERQLFLAADGEDLRGEDRLIGDAGQDFVIRFHLHPNVQASMTQDGSAALLRLPSGAGWRLRAEGAVLSLADSVYLGTGELRKSQQIVLGGHVGSQGATVRWAIRREGRRRADVLATSAPNAREQPRERS